MFDIVETHIENIIPGDTIVHNGNLKTVCKKDIGYSSFMGRSVFGDCYHSGHKPVKKAIIFHSKPQLYDATKAAQAS